MEQKISAFCTLATGEYYDKGGTANLVKSAKKFHPDVPFYVFSEPEIGEILSQKTLLEQAVSSLPLDIKPPYRQLEMGYLHCLLGKALSKTYDLVIYIDCDSLITAPLAEVFEEDYEVAGVRNMADNGRSGCFTVSLDGTLDPLKYINGGFTASRSKEFWDCWIALNLKVSNPPFAEQYTLNYLFHSGLFKTLLLDPPESKVYYGTASTYGEQTHWDSWQRIVVEDGLLKLDGKTVKILHEAGGPQLPKMDLGLFTPQISQWIKENILC